jgi:hypothetical protein
MNQRRKFCQSAPQFAESFFYALVVVVICGCEGGLQKPGVVGTPTLMMPGVVSMTGTHESLNWVSKDGATVVFSRANADFTQSDVLIARRNIGKWVTVIAPYSTSIYDADTSLSPDMSSVIFTSTRPTSSEPGESWNIWTATADIGELSFGSPKALPFPVNSEHSECCPVFLSNSEFLFSSNRLGSWDIFYAKSTFGEFDAIPLVGAVNSERGEWPNHWDNAHNVLIMSSTRAGGRGGDDVYWSKSLDGDFGRPMVLAAPINSDGYEDNARVYWGAFYWSSRRKGTSKEPTDSDVYWLPEFSFNE